MSDTEERAVAYHEAGHVVVSRWFGMAVKRVSVVSDDETAGRVEHNPIGDWFRPDIEIDARTRRRIEQDIMVLWAGRLAVDRLLGIGHQHDSDGIVPLPDGTQVVHPDSDMHKIIDLALHFTGGNDYKAEPYMEWLRRCTEGLLAREDVWMQVEAVAEALLVEGTLTGRRVREVMDEANEAWMAAHITPEHRRVFGLEEASG